MADEVELPSGFTLLARGPGVVEVVEGEVEVFGARIGRGSKLQVPEGRVLPLEAVADSFLRAPTGETVKGSTVPAQWKELAEEALDAGTVMLIGPNDVGKSSLALYLANAAVRRGRRPAIVDADIGQTDIGPPGTIGLTMPAAPSPTYSGLELLNAYFVGDKSPVGHLLPMVVGSQLLVREALGMGASPVIVNTTGLVEGSVGWALKVHKVEALRPDLLVAIDRGSELDHILRSIPRSIRVRRLRPPEIFRKDRPGRVRYRTVALAALAAKKVPVELNLRALRILNARALSVENDGELARRIEAAIGVRPEVAGRFGEEAVAVFRSRLDQHAFSYVTAILEGAGEPRVVTLDRLEGLYLGLLDANDRFIGVGRMSELDLRSGTMRGEAV
ncbi:MAG: Clp1/GlmU family protein, partial [Conexivisphaera sp.]